MAAELKDFFIRHRGKVIGSVIGLVIALLIIHYGFLRALFICALTIIGYVVGKRLDDEQSGLGELLDRILPSGQR